VRARVRAGGPPRVACGWGRLARPRRTLRPAGEGAGAGSDKGFAVAAEFTWRTFSPEMEGKKHSHREPFFHTCLGFVIPFKLSCACAVVVWPPVSVAGDLPRVRRRWVFVFVVLLLVLVLVVDFVVLVRLVGLGIWRRAMRSQRRRRFERGRGLKGRSGEPADRSQGRAPAGGEAFGVVAGARPPAHCGRRFRGSRSSLSILSV
jgi:hypothetical protein